MAVLSGKPKEIIINTQGKPVKVVFENGSSVEALKPSKPVVRSCGRNLFSVEKSVKGSPFPQYEVVSVKQVRDFIIPFGKFRIAITVYKKVKT